MTYALKRCTSLLTTLNSILPRSNFATSPVYRQDDPKQIKLDVILMNATELEQKEKLKGHISTKGPMDVSSISGTPKEHIRERVVRIYEPIKNCMQSGTDNLVGWEIEFDNRERWENPLIGWASTGDPISNVRIKFSTKEDAIAHCEKNGWRWFVQEGTQKPQRKKSYTDIFSWNRRTRASTK